MTYSRFNLAVMPVAARVDNSLFIGTQNSVPMQTPFFIQVWTECDRNQIGTYQQQEHIDFVRMLLGK